MLAGIGAGIAGAAAAAFSLRGISEEFKRITGLQDSFGKLAQQTGVSVQALTELDYAASLSDVSTDELGGALGRLSAKMADVAQGSAEAKGVFDDLGVKVKNTDGTLRSSEEVLKDIAQRFSEFRDGSTKSAFAIEIFGRSGAKLIPMLNMGRAGLAEMAEEAHAAGVVFDQDAARKAEIFNDNLTRIGKTIDGLTINAFGPLIESLGDVGTAFLSAQRHSNDFWGSLLTGFRVLGRDGDLEKQLADVDRVLREKYSLRDGLRGNIIGRAGEQIYNAFSPEFLELDGQIKQLHRDREGILRAMDARINADMSALGVFDPKLTPQLNDRNKRKPTEDPLRSIIDGGLSRDADRQRELADFWNVRVPQKLADDEERMRAQADSWRDIIDPAREYTRQLEEIRALVKEGALSKPEGIAAEFELESRRNDEMLGGMVDTAKETSDAARELGLTFQSAFEDAIIEGKKFSDVLAGIGQDLLRLTIRKNVTEKAAGWLSTKLNLGSLFGGPKLASGIDFVPYDNYPALLHRGERVVPAVEASKSGRDVSIVNNYTFGAGVNVAQLKAAAEQIKRDTEASVFNKMRRANYSGDYGAMGF